MPAVGETANPSFKLVEEVRNQAKMNIVSSRIRLKSLRDLKFSWN